MYFKMAFPMKIAMFTSIRLRQVPPCCFECGFLCFFKIYIDFNFATHEIHIMKKTSFENYCFILSYIYQNFNKIESGFPATSG